LQTVLNAERGTQGRRISGGWVLGMAIAIVLAALLTLTAADFFGTAQVSNSRATAPASERLYGATQQPVHGNLAGDDQGYVTSDGGHGLLP
jgi:hypothetical protein